MLFLMLDVSLTRDILLQYAQTSLDEGKLHILHLVREGFGNFSSINGISSRKRFSIRCLMLGFSSENFSRIFVYFFIPVVSECGQPSVLIGISAYRQ